MSGISGKHALAELVVDLGAVAHNVRTLVRVAAPAKVMVVVKADGYNHGMVDVARTALDAGAAELGVATLDEAFALRDAGVTAPVTAWMWLPDAALTDVAAVRAARITLGVPSVEHLRMLVGALGGTEQEQDREPLRVGLMADTGLSRSGIEPDRWDEAVALAVAAEHDGVLQVTGVLSHLASADDPSSPVTDLQARRFSDAVASCRAAGLDVPVNHIANTPATLSRPDLRHEMVRPGVSVYGVYAVDPTTVAADSGPVDLREAMTVRARVVTTRVVPAGEGVSYSHLWHAERDTRTAVVAMGYADGLPRSLSGRFGVTVNGTWFPQIGRVCMDQVVVDLGPADDLSSPGAAVRPGDWAVIFGEGGRSVEEIATAADTIAYEILTLPRGRLARRTLPAQPDVPAFTGPSGTVTAASADAMRGLGRTLGGQLRAGDVVVLTGALGAGKTTFTQGLAVGMGVKGRVQSPTFTIIREHRPTGDGPGLLHMDAYRLIGEDSSGTPSTGAVLDALESLDIDADLEDRALVAEWGQGVVEALAPARCLEITIDRGADDAARALHWSWSER